MDSTAKIGDSFPKLRALLERPVVLELKSTGPDDAAASTTADRASKNIDSSPPAPSLAPSAASDSDSDSEVRASIPVTPQQHSSDSSFASFPSPSVFDSSPSLFDSTLSERITIALNTAAVHPQYAEFNDFEMESNMYSPGFFSGRDGEDPEMFLDNLCAYASLRGATAPEKLLPLALKDGARAWYISLSAATKNDLDAFKAAFLQRYGPADIISFSKVGEIFESHQKPNEKVRDYVSRISHQCSLAKLLEEMTVKALLNGLLPSLRTFVLSKTPKTLEDVEKEAVTAELISPKDDRTVIAAVDELRNQVEQMQMTRRSPSFSPHRHSSRSPAHNRRVRFEPSRPTYRGPRRQQSQKRCYRCNGVKGRTQGPATLGMQKKRQALLMVVLQLIMIGKASGQKPLYRVNYGVVLEPVTALSPIKEYWTHMIKINILSVPDIPTGNPVLGQCKPVNSQGLYCEVLQEIVDNLVGLRNNTATMIRETASNIRDLVPEAEIPRAMSRTKRSLLPFLGNLANSLIGVATEADVASLAEHISALENKTQQTGHLFSQHSKRMISFMMNTDERINKAIAGIKNNHDYIHMVAETVVQELDHTVELTTRAMKTLSGYVKFASLIQFQLEKLEAGINEIIHGQLSSSILPPAMCHRILYHVSQRSSVHFPDLELASMNIEHIYQITDVLLTRYGDSLYLVLKLPLKSVSMGHATVYEVLAMPMPVPNNPARATQLVNIPSYVAVTDNNKFYASLEAKDLTACSGVKLRVCNNPLPFKSTAAKSCIVALIHGNTPDIKHLCNFTFTLQEPTPYIIKLSTGQVIVSDKNDISMQCHAGSRVLSGCSHCIYDVPCSCSVQTKSAYIPPSVVNCKGIFSESTPLHTVNLAVLQQFFDDSALSNISAHVTYSKPLEVQIPQIRVYQHELSDIMGSDKQQHLNLKNVIQATKNDEWAYKSLAEPILTGRLLPQTSHTFNYTDLLSYAAIAISFLLTAGIVYLLFKMNHLAVTVATLSQLNKSTTATALPPLVYTLPTFPTDNSFTNVWNVFYQDYLYQGIIVVLFIMATIIYIRYKYGKTTHSTIIALEITNGTACAILPIQPLPFCPEHWQFESASLLSDVQIEGCVRPQVHVNWHNLTLRNTFTGQMLKPKAMVKISPWIAYHARKILHGPHNVYTLMIHQNYAFHLGIGAGESHVPPEIDPHVHPEVEGEDACSESNHA